MTDNKGTTAVSTVQITVNPAGNTSVPVANAGTNQTISLPATTTSLTGSGTVSGGTISSYNWTQTSGPSSSSIASPNASTTAVTGLAQGTYQFQLKVTDNSGKTALSTVQVTVNAAATGNLFPAVNPGYTVNGLNYKYYERWRI